MVRGVGRGGIYHLQERDDEKPRLYHSKQVELGKKLTCYEIAGCEQATVAGDKGSM